jgi:hypothetical protein
MVKQNVMTKFRIRYLESKENQVTLFYIKDLVFDAVKLVPKKLQIEIGPKVKVKSQSCRLHVGHIY